MVDVLNSTRIETVKFLEGLELVIDSLLVLGLVHLELNGDDLQAVSLREVCLALLRQPNDDRILCTIWRELVAIQDLGIRSLVNVSDDGILHVLQGDTALLGLVDVDFIPLVQILTCNFLASVTDDDATCVLGNEVEARLFA